MLKFGEVLSSYFGAAGSTTLDQPGVTTPLPQNLRRLRCDVNGYLQVLPAAGGLTDVNITEIAGNVVATTGITGTMPSEGTQAAEIAIDDGSFPVKIGLRVRNILVAIVDDQITNALADTLGRLWTRSAAYDVLTNTDRVSNLNLDADDHDLADQLIADETDVAAATHYYPSADGIELGNRNFLGCVFTIDDGDIDFEVSNDRATWVNATGAPVDLTTGLNGYDNTHYTSAAGISTDFAVDHEKLGHRFWRLVFVPPNATNDIEATIFTRAI